MVFRAAASGATVTRVAGYRVFTFTSSGTLEVTTGGDCLYLVVAGGGAGGAAAGGSGGGGGGGAVAHSDPALYDPDDIVPFVLSLRA